MREISKASPNTEKISNTDDTHKHPVTIHVVGHRHSKTFPGAIGKCKNFNIVNKLFYKMGGGRAIGSSHQTRLKIILEANYMSVWSATYTNIK